MKFLRSLILFLGFIALFFQPYDSRAEQLTIVIGDALPPWTIPENNSGIILDILEQALGPAGYEINYIYAPNARRLLLYATEKIDGVCDINLNRMKISNLEGYLSDIAYEYENIGVSLKERGYKFLTINDLTNYRVAGWQGAKDEIGFEYKQMANKNPDYSEVRNQITLVKLLFAERVDLIQLDKQIFHYYRKKVSDEGRINTQQPVDIFHLFGKNECRFLFRNKKVKDVFDQQLKIIKENGQYAALFKKYFQ